ncbi:toxin YoeB [Peptoniphilus asaccharolyticus DSM 20463]|uniref:Endoribonuclease YoeB n=1 Tax=Peptoniphilus asaccharolyticus DSM 20463 TaxID=573058 RepID=A0A1W1UC43_PEPAS|nr:Txe/YoeB family addiction module toxin [Peptoniphilus asaccharolyticus]MBL7576425.1 Txe/YoeB family addiction module toxin [Peptoniphilus asaccharolyticus]SMB78613.1 toxin YoeB [Peptoniphilus asaccharolyticus DSM 20463]
MKKIWVDEAWEEYLFWLKEDKKILKRINDLIKDIDRNKNKGIGKPEALRFELSGFWSRRINSEHRLIYKIENNSIYIISCKGHYKS